MSERHNIRFILYTLIGLVFTTAGVISLVYSSAKKSSDDWFFWAIISAFCINAGLLLLGSSIVHKIKSELAGKKRQSRPV